jgi:hypothetical protein
MSAYTPFPSASTRDSEEDRFWLERELSLLENALDEEGELRRRDLGRLVGCKYWGPGRFAKALKKGVEDGRFKHPRFGVYAPN